jgi:hypothetical protein
LLSTASLFARLRIFNHRKPPHNKLVESRCLKRLPEGDCGDDRTVDSGLLIADNKKGGGPKTPY